MKLFLILMAAAVPAYILGGINGAIIASKYLYKKDIRRFGSGNPGLTNFYRVFGKGGALLVIAIDAAKAIMPVLFSGWLFGHFYDMSLFGREFSGFFVILGHCYPMYYGFAGGKGVMTAGTVVITIDWKVALASWGAFIITTAAVRYVSLASILAAVAYPLCQLVFGIGGIKELMFAVFSAALLIIRHRGNIKRLIKGEETKLNFKK